MVITSGPRVLIIVNGAMDEYSTYASVVQASDYIISVDGGTDHAYRMGLTPDLIVGDLDSIDPAVRDTYRQAGCTFATFPPAKDWSDLELALDYAAKLIPSEVTIIGALGKRFDHTFGNIGLLAAMCDKGIPTRIVDSVHTIQVFDRELAVTGRPGDYLSLFPVTPQAEGVTTQALQYPLHHETLFFGATRGLSNVLLADTARVTVEKGKLLAIHVRK